MATVADILQKQQLLLEWSPTARPRELRTFADFPDLSPEDIEAALASDDQGQQLRAIGTLYKAGDYKRVRDFFKKDAGRLGNSGKLILVLAYLQLFAENRISLDRYALPLLKELLTQEPSEFGSLYDWVQDYIQERPMPQQFYEQSQECQR
ncbi:MAG TPA: hypothetical protein PLJ78_10980 [Anaerolineae bacterium]|nr:hypothetical protein [Anaerolineae bacterium]HQK14451.1 hypothetical protein [Anaerolineae bacterium]